MKTYESKEAIITEVGSGLYSIDIDNGIWKWTDEMFEGLAKDELTAEEAIRLFGELCCNFDCSVCPINSIGCGDEDCGILRAEHPGEIIEALKQWKKDHKKKEIKTEIVDFIKIMKEVCDDETCIYAYEIDTSKEDIVEKMDELVKQYYEENGGKIYAKFERICRVKVNETSVS